ncbi:MAG: hypothetical protein ACR2HH_13615 [Chthoniobacterales bacterium]
MKPRWYFAELRPGDKTREPTLGEFFATDAIRDPAEALVREALQNSLDAGERDDAGQPTETVTSRIFLATGEHALAPDEITEFFSGSWPHFEAKGNGLVAPPTPTEPCPFLVIEDFGTSGLSGDVRQWHDVPGANNSFFYFFRAEGRTGKGGEDRGRWGVGKYVFPRSSRANSFFGLTVRADDREKLLMGQAVLKTHASGSKHYKPDGGFGELEGDLLLPVRDPVLISQFCSTFSLRRTDEPGLSIVVPWIDAETTRESLVQAVVRGYFYPILEGKLAVTVAIPGSETEITDATLAGVIRSLGEGTATELAALIELAEWSCNRKPSEIPSLNPPRPDRPTWSTPDIIPHAAISPLQTQLERGDRIALRIPLVVRTNRQQERDSHFHLFMVNDGSARERTVFVREGIIISDLRPRRAHGIRSMVVVDHKPLATLLGDSENPAHTQWQKDSSNFRDKYPKVYGKAVIDFVTHCVAGIVSVLSSHQREEDKNLLKDFFSLPAPPEPDATKSRQKRKKKKGTEPEEKPELPEPRKRRYRLEQVPGGFRVTAGEPDAELPPGLDIRVAYDVRRGNAFKRYDRGDFNVADASFKIECDGVTIEQRSENRLSIALQNREFRFAVSGFDEDRDLCVDVKVKEEGTTDAAAI